MARDHVPTGGATGSLPSQSGPYKILLVDDEPDNIASIKRLIRKDFEIFSATSAEEALPLLNKISNLEIILCDQRMPGLQGSEFLEKAKDFDSVITRILLTGFSDLEAVTDAVNKGQIWRYISKPWEPAALIQVLNEGAQKCRTERNLKNLQTELKKKVSELEAKDWARGRLIHILQHEFRTAPLVLDGVCEIAKNLKGENLPDLLRFVTNLSKRFELLDKELSDFVSDETHQVETMEVLVSDFFVQVFRNFPFKLQAEFLKTERISILPQKTAGALEEILKAISQTEPPSLLEASLQKKENAIFVLEILVSPEQNGGDIPVPRALRREKVKAEIAWRALFEPFVGGDELLNHSQGLRLSLASAQRHLHKLGWRTEPVADLARQKIQVFFKIPIQEE